MMSFGGPDILLQEPQELATLWSHIPVAIVSDTLDTLQNDIGNY